MKKLTRNLGIAIAAAGCTNCIGGAVDMIPAPTSCSDYGTGDGTISLGDANLETTDGKTALVIEWQFDLHWFSSEVDRVEVQDVVGAAPGTTASLAFTGDASEPTRSANVEIPLGQLPASGSFKLLVWTKDGRKPDLHCSLEVTVEFEVRSARVGDIDVRTLPSSDNLPLRERHAVHVEPMEQRDGVIRLAAHTTFPGSCEFAWATTGGRLEVVDGGLAVWHLPQTPGVFQAQLIADFGEHGLAFDTLEVEVA